MWYKEEYQYKLLKESIKCYVHKSVDIEIKDILLDESFESIRLFTILVKGL